MAKAECPHWTALFRERTPGVGSQPSTESHNGLDGTKYQIGVSYKTKGEPGMRGRTMEAFHFDHAREYLLMDEKRRQKYGLQDINLGRMERHNSGDEASNLQRAGVAWGCNHMGRGIRIFTCQRLQSSMNV
jgi:hypothetical protein